MDKKTRKAVATGLMLCLVATVAGLIAGLAIAKWAAAVYVLLSCCYTGYVWAGRLFEEVFGGEKE